MLANGVWCHVPKVGEAVRRVARKNLAEILKSDAEVVGRIPQVLRWRWK